MKKLWDILMMMLAFNFLALAGGVGWMYQTGRLDHARVMAVKDVLFPKPVIAPTTQPSAENVPPDGIKRLEELLAKNAGKRTAAEQVALIQQNFDATMYQLDQRERTVQDLERQVAAENQRLANDRAALDAERQALKAREQEANRLENDKGFQDTLALYNAMPSKQAKSVFMTLDDATVAQYLDAMEPRSAARIIKEFKTPDETERIKRILEKMRKPPTPGAPATQDSKEQ